MGGLTIEVPASYSALLDMGGARALMRKVLLWQRHNGESLAVLENGAPIAIGFLVPNDAGEVELALSIRAGARARMMLLCRLAHLTLSRVHDTGAVVICHVAPGNRAGQRMARLTGFTPDGVDRWTWSGHDGGSGEGAVRRRRWRGEEGSGRKPASAAGGE